MNIMRWFHKYISYRQKDHPWMQQWKRRLSLLLALITPGLPQVLSRKQLFGGSILFLFGTGALISIMISVYSGGNIRAFDAIFGSAVPNFSAIYPLHISPSIASSDNLIPIHPEGEPLFVQPFFWELLYTCIILYVVCAMISFWHQWKTGRNEEVEKLRS